MIIKKNILAMTLFGNVGSQKRQAATMEELAKSLAKIQDCIHIILYSFLESEIHFSVIF